MEFVAIDVETANADVSSICQIGVVVCRGGAIAGEWKTYIDPEDYFDAVNVSIHGIDESMVKGAPTIKQVADKIDGFLNGRVTVCHTHFDRIAVHRGFEKYRVRTPQCTWLDSARVARRTWKEAASRGYGLRDLCHRIGYQFEHHDALEDAKAAAQIMLAAISITGLSVEDWLRRVRQPIDFGEGSSGSSWVIKRDGNPEGPLFGEILVFTGALTIPRREAADMAAVAGCTVAAGVTKETTILVVGDQDVLKLAGHEKSSKQRKAEQLIPKGQAIRILRETDFRQLVELCD